VIAVAGIFAVLLVSGSSLAFAQTGNSVQIPSWIKFSAEAWIEGTTSDQEFANALEFLIKEKIIQSPSITVLDVAPTDVTQKTQVVIPSWIKFSAEAWTQGTTSDQEFANAIEFLIKEKIIHSPKIQIGAGPGPGLGDITELDPGTDEDYTKLLELSLDLIEDEPTISESRLTTDERIAAATNQQTDSDLDGIPDADEISGTLGYITDPNKADTDGDGINDLREYWWNINPTSRDTNNDFISDGDSLTDKDLKIYPYQMPLDKSIDPDEDGIPTAAELFDVGTKFKVWSTDGDRYDDGSEFFLVSSKQKPLPAYVIDPDPLYPHTPDIRITVDQDVTFWPGTTETLGTKALTENSYTMTNSEDSTNTYSIGSSTSVTATGTISTSLGDNKASLTLETKVDFEARHTSTFSQSKESQLMTSEEAYSITSTELGKTTKLQMWFTIENVGNDLLTDPLTELIFNFYLGNDKRPFHTKSFTEGGVDLARITNLEPRDTLTLTIKDIPLNLDQAKRFLANEAVRVEAAHYSFGEDQEYFINAQASNLQLVTVSKSGIDSRYVYLPNAMNLEQVLETANIDYQIDSTGHFTSIGNMEAQTNTLPYKTLAILHTPNPNSISSSPSSVADMTFENGDILVIKHQIDTDGDLLSDEDELLIGTDKNNPDTDGDTLTDGFTDSTRNLVGELDGCTNPLLIDTDWDGTNDNVELEEGTDPCEGGGRGPTDLLYPIFSKPVAPNQDGRLEVFGIGTDGVLWHIWQKGPNGAGGFSDWDSLGGVVSDIEVARNADGRLEVFDIGTDGALWHIWQTVPNGAWSGWSSLGGVLSNIEVGQNQDGRLEVFGIGTDDALWHIWQGGGAKDGWSDWDRLGGVVADIEVGLNADGRLEVFGIGSDFGLHHIWQTAPNSGWSGWSSLGGKIADIAVGRNADGRLEVFTIGTDRALYHMWQGGDAKDGWSNWDRLGGIVSEIEVGHNADGRLEVFGIGTDNGLHHIWQTAPNSGWSGWSSLGGKISDIAVGQNADGRLEVFAIGGGSALYHMSQGGDSKDGWSDWAGLGGVANFGTDSIVNKVILVQITAGK